MNQWLKNAAKLVFGNTEIEPIDGIELSEEEAEQIETAVQKALNNHYQNIFASLDLPIPTDTPLIESCHIISCEEEDEDDDFYETNIEITTDDNEHKTYKISDLLILYNYPMSLMEVGNIALAENFLRQCNDHSIYEQLLKEKEQTIKVTVNENSSIELNLNLQAERQSIPEKYQIVIEAIRAILSDERADLQKVDIGFDKALNGETILYIDHPQPLSQEDIHYLEDIARINLPDNVRGMKIDIQQTSELQKQLCKIVCKPN